MQHIKARNSNYFHWAKALREMVYCYGKDNDGEFDLPGPFYTGMSVVLKVPEFRIVLNSPTSTSTELSVAMKFSGENGMVLQFQNKDGHSRRVKGMDCTWISRYREESERYCFFLILFISLFTQNQYQIFLFQQAFFSYSISIEYFLNSTPKDSSKLQTPCHYTYHI